MSQGPTNTKHLAAAFGHHKCASMWVHGICEQVCLDLGLRLGCVFGEKEFGADLQRYVRERNVEFLLYGNADFHQVQRLPAENLRAFHYVRDPRDIVVSAYFSHRNSHSTDAWPELLEYREKLRSCSKEQGLFLELEFRSQQFQEMRSWKQLTANGSIRRYQVEEVIARPYETFLEIFGWLGLLDQEHYSASKRLRFLLAKVGCRLERLMGSAVHLPRAISAMPAEGLLGIVNERDFSRLSGGRRQGQADPGSHYRRGVHGDWLNHFSVEHLQVFKERYGDLVLQYGYEDDVDWDRKYLPVIQQRLKNPQRLDVHGQAVAGPAV
jgi:hypothetical protein